jgi:hypothetical protein
MAESAMTRTALPKAAWKERDFIVRSDFSGKEMPACGLPVAGDAADF